MKKILTLILTAAMLLSASVTVFAEDAAELALVAGSHLVLDRDSGYVDKIDGTITVAQLKSNFAGDISVADKADDAVVATDDVITAGADTLKALIYGDVDRNGKINLGDVSGMLKSIAKWDNDINTDAADVDKNEKINLADVSKMLKKLAKWDDISLGNVRMVFENKALTAEHEDSTLQLSFTNLMNKLGAKGNVHTGENAFKIKMARNENESCMALLWSDTNKEGMTAELSEFVSEFGDATMESDLEWIVFQPSLAVFTRVIGDNGYTTDPQEVEINDFPEVVMDMADTFELKAERNQQFVITAKSTKETPAGMYTATLTIRDADGKEVKCATVYAYVWDFTVPDAPYSASLFGTASYGVNYVDYYNHMLENNLSSYILPYEITSEEADAYMSDPRVTAFAIAGCTAGPNGEYGTAMYANIMSKTPEQTVANYNKVMSNPEWAKKGLFYYTDEPSGDALFVIRDTYNYVTELLGTTNIRNMTPLSCHSYPDDDHKNKNIDVIEFMDPYINVWCPQAHAYHNLEDGGRWTPRYAYNKYGNYSERVKAFREKGEEIWWYVCVDPQIPYPNYFNLYQGVINRLLSWQQYMNNVDGSLYYATGNSWNSISKHQFVLKDYGDGCLQFPGEKWGRVGPQASWRLYQIRDGFDDFDYMKIAEELCGREAVMKSVNKVTWGMLKYTEDYKVLDAARDEIVKMILEAQAK